MARGSGRGANIGEAFSCSGILKICEAILSFIIIMLHRHGDNGQYLFFSTNSEQLQNNDQTHALDTENLGNGTIVAFFIIPAVLLLSYVLDVDGRYHIQKTFLEWWWNFIGACCYLGLGIKTVWAWHGFQETEPTLASGTASDNAIACGLAMGSLSILNGLIFLSDAFIAYQTKKRINRDEQQSRY